MGIGMCFYECFRLGYWLPTTTFEKSKCFPTNVRKTRPAKGDTIRQISLFLWRATVPLNMSNNLWYFWSIRFGRKPILRTERHLSVWWILLSRLFVNILSFFFRRFEHWGKNSFGLLPQVLLNQKFNWLQPVLCRVNSPIMWNICQARAWAWADRTKDIFFTPSPPNDKC